eukprot:scaffold45929_cov26-Tisochrysis_lutea.AAC.1
MKGGMSGGEGNSGARAMSEFFRYRVVSRTSTHYESEKGPCSRTDGALPPWPVDLPLWAPSGPLFRCA